MTRKVSNTQVIESRAEEFIFSFALFDGEILPHVTFGFYPEPLGNVKPQTITLKVDPKRVLEKLRALLDEADNALLDAVRGELSVHISESVPAT